MNFRTKKTFKIITLFSLALINTACLSSHSTFACDLTNIEGQGCRSVSATNLDIDRKKKDSFYNSEQNLEKELGKTQIADEESKSIKNDNKKNYYIWFKNSDAKPQSIKIKKNENAQ